MFNSSSDDDTIPKIEKKPTTAYLESERKNGNKDNRGKKHEQRMKQKKKQHTNKSLTTLLAKRANKINKNNEKT